MICVKYKKHSKFTVVAPAWVEDLIKKLAKSEYVTNTYDGIVLHTSEGKVVEIKQGKKILTIRCDIFPISNEKMLSLLRYSEKDVLLTGDQSITDVLSCCPKKNIFYQIAPWKENFAKNLARYLPNDILSHKKTSCGGISYTKYKSNYTGFIKTWDFRKKGKKKMDALMAYAIDKRHGDITYIVDCIKNSKTLPSLKSKILDLIK